MSGDSCGGAVGLCDRVRDREHAAAGQRRERAALEHRSIERHDVAAIDAHEVVTLVEPFARRGPDVVRRLAEVAAIRRERGFVPVVELAIFGRTALRRPVMQRPLERVAAQRVPVVPRVQSGAGATPGRPRRTASRDGLRARRESRTCGIPRSPSRRSARDQPLSRASRAENGKAASAASKSRPERRVQVVSSCMFMFYLTNFTCHLLQEI